LLFSGIADLGEFVEFDVVENSVQFFDTPDVYRLYRCFIADSSGAIRFF